MNKHLQSDCLYWTVWALTLEELNKRPGPAPKKLLMLLKDKYFHAFNNS